MKRVLSAVLVSVCLLGGSVSAYAAEYTPIGCTGGPASSLGAPSAASCMVTAPLIRYLQEHYNEKLPKEELSNRERVARNLFWVALL